MRKFTYTRYLKTISEKLLCDYIFPCSLGSILFVQWLDNLMADFRMYHTLNNKHDLLLTEGSSQDETWIHLTYRFARGIDTSKFTSHAAKKSISRPHTLIRKGPSTWCWRRTRACLYKYHKPNDSKCSHPTQRYTIT